ncbi:leukocyte elastase inhibitor-like isoform X1 [Tachysurus ichikawai]
MTLHHPTAKDDIHVSFNKLMSELNKAGTPYTLSLANRLYGEQTYQFVELESVDFKSNAEASRVKINNWVEKQTKEKIKNLLAQGVLDNLTRLVLVNAIYFKCNWEKQFKLQGTKELPFRLNKLEKHLTYEKFMECTRPDMMDTVEVQVSLPRFKLEQNYDLEKLLISMGMVDAFDPSKCDFSRMSPCSDLVLSKVVHKSFVDVTEEGTEAAAATAVTMIPCCAILISESFVADHPFLFFIQHKPTRSILFCGRYSSP